MPATHYIVSVQIALVAASAAYLKSDKSAPLLVNDPVKVSRPTRPHAGYVDVEEEAVVMEVPMARAMAMHVGGERPPELEERSMGFRPGGQARPRLPNQDATRPLFGSGSMPPRAVPVEGGIPETGAQLSAVAFEEVRFDPVPDGHGYSITADSATNFDLATKTVVFSGNVSLQCVDFALTSDRLVVHMDAEGGAMRRMIANGNVDVKLLQGAVTERYHGSGEEADFDPEAQKIILRGWPRIIGHGREHRAASASTKMTLFTKPARLETEGRAQTRILPGQGGELPGIAVQ